MIHLHTPLTAENVRNLKVGDEVRLSGTIFTGRDAVHKYLYEDGALPPEVNLRDGVIYHCGPVVLKDALGKWQVTAAGPTTSSREEPYQNLIIQKFGVRAVIGKGGMGQRTLAACKSFGCIYLHAIGGAAQVLAECVRQVKAVYLLDKFGSPEAIWELEVADFPAFVTMDAHGVSLHEQVLLESEAALKRDSGLPGLKSERT